MLTALAIVTASLAGTALVVSIVKAVVAYKAAHKPVVPPAPVAKPKGRRPRKKSV